MVLGVNLLWRWFIKRADSRRVKFVAQEELQEASSLADPMVSSGEGATQACAEPTKQFPYAEAIARFVIEQQLPVFAIAAALQAAFNYSITTQSLI
jgi:hypothetical protein